MLMPQNIQEKRFETARFGGYDTAAVDDFLEQIHEDYAALYKENALLKSKLKVLVEKVEEYRSTENSMRMALLTAQKMANEIQTEAEAKADAILAKAEEEAKRRSVELRQKLAEEEARLAEAERKTAAFSARVLDLISEEQAFLEGLKDLTLAMPVAVKPDPALSAPPAADRTVRTPAKPVAAPPAVPPVKEDDFSLDDIESSVGAYLAQEVSRMTAASMDSPFVEDETKSVSRPPASSDEAGASSEVDYLKMFDQDHVEEPPPAAPVVKAVPVPAANDRAAEKIDIAQSISSALGDTKELSVDVDAFYDDEGQPTTTRPKFDFEDLQFGINYDEDDDI